MPLTPREEQAWRTMAADLAPDMPTVPGPFRAWWQRSWPGVIILAALMLAAVAVYIGGALVGDWLRLR